MSLDRAVLVFAGVMVLVSAALTYFVSPMWLLLTCFVGLNLIQSSFTAAALPKLETITVTVTAANRDAARALLDDGRALDAATVVYATGDEAGKLDSPLYGMIALAERRSAEDAVVEACAVRAKLSVLTLVVIPLLYYALLSARAPRVAPA